MTKRLVSVAIMLFIAASSFSQTKPTDSSTSFIAAFNAEQMLEKMGFDNLMKALFENKQQDKNNTPEAVAKKATIRKALAAIYGAGINFNKKIWVLSRQGAVRDVAAPQSWYKNYETPLTLVSVPVANRQVMQENILKLMAAEEKKSEAVKFSTTEDVLWMQDGKTVTLLTKTEMIVATLPKKMNDYNDNLYYGITIKSDTVVTPKIKTWADDESVETIEKPVVIEIDKIQPGGKIKRVYTYKEKKEQTYAAPKVEEIMVDSAVAAVVDTTVVMVDSFAVAAPAEDIAVTTKDTLTRSEYLNDSTFITHYYIAFTDTEKDSLQKIYQQEKELQLQKQALEFVQHYQTYLPQQSNELIQQLSADTADMVFYSTTGSASPYSYFGSRFFGSSTASLLNNQPAAVTAINFTNGLVTMRSTYSNSADTAASIFNQLYKPVTNFWPAALGSPVLGNMQCNINVPQLAAYIKNVAAATGASDKFSSQMKREGIDFEEIEKAFTGQMAAAIHPGVSKYGKKQPRLLIGLQINNAAAAVNFMNRMGSKKTNSVNTYRFDENAQYLLFDTDGKNGLFKQAVAPVQKMAAPEAGTVAALNLNVKAIMLAFTKDSKKNNTGYKQAQQFFSTINVTAATSATGNFTTVFTAGMGSSKTNALYNLMQLISGSGNGGGLPKLFRGF